MRDSKRNNTQRNIQTITPSMTVLALVAATAVASPTTLDLSQAGDQRLDPTLNNSGFNGIFNFELSGLGSWDAQGDDSNDTLDYYVGYNMLIFGIQWDIGIQTLNTSWLSEVTLSFEDELYITPGQGEDLPGTGHYSSGGYIDLLELGLAFYVGDDGILDLEIFESYDDVNNEIDALFLPGSNIQLMTFLTPPTPGTASLLGIAGFAASRRRRS